MPINSKVLSLSQNMDNMMSYKIVKILLSLLFFLSAMFGYSQKSKKEYKKELEDNFVTAKVTDSLFSGGAHEDFTFDFRNVNHVNFYYDASKLAHIKKLKASGQDEKLIKALEDYIKHFGIRNFSENVNMLWELAQLYEEKEEHIKAVAIYRLTLKHHPRTQYQQIVQFHKIKEHFDDITTLDKDYFVPLDYYYKLVEYRKAVDTLIPPKSVLANMGDLVNSYNTADYGPSISIHDDLIIFTKKTPATSGLNPEGKYDEDLYYSKNYDGFWDESVKFEEPINSRCGEGSAVVSRDGKTLYFARCKDQDNLLDCSDCLGSCDIYYAKKNNDKWGKPKNLGPEINTAFWDSHPTLSPDGNTLYFSSNRPGGFGLADIWYTKRLKGDKWSKPKNMGPIINTRNNEYSPFMNKMGDVFYFSSNGHILNFADENNKKNVRTMDIYKSNLVKGKWAEPKNIGPLVNGNGDEYYFTMDSRAENLYYARTEESNENEAMTDLYSFPVPMGAQPEATVTLKGTLNDQETGDPYKGIVSVIDLENGIEVAPKFTRPDGTFEFDLIDHQKYLLVIQGDEFFRIEKLFTLNGDTTIHAEAKSARNRKLQFTSIVFENGKWDILEEMEKDLWNVIDFLVDNPEFNLKIGGHTDSDGNPQSNLNLSQKRAEAIKEFVVANGGGIQSDRIDAVGYGSAKPLRSPEVTEEDKRINRRVEFEIIRNEDPSQGDDFSDAFDDE